MRNALTHVEKSRLVLVQSDMLPSPENYDLPLPLLSM